MQLEELKKAFNHCRSSITQAQILLEKREKCIQELFALKEQANSDRTAILRAKEELKKIDHALDLLDEEPSQNLERLQEELIAAIILQHPESEQEFQRLSHALFLEKQKEMKLAALYKKMSPLYAIFKQGNALRQVRYSWIAILFGKSKSGKIGRLIAEGLDLAQPLIKEVEDPRFLHFLETFKKEAEKPWNHALYQKRFFELFEELSLLMSKLEEELADSTQKRGLLEKALEFQIDKFAR